MRLLCRLPGVSLKQVQGLCYGVFRQDAWGLGGFLWVGVVLSVSLMSRNLERDRYLVRNPAMRKERT